MTKPELLAPAGDLERLRAALYFGADAVYAGGPRLHLRAAAVDFTLEGLRECAALCHKAGKKFYVTVNAFARNGDFDVLPQYARDLLALGADAALVSDLGVLQAMRRAAPDLPLHVSTQANCLNYETARFWHSLGASRVVLGRELSLEEIREIRAKTPPELELEAFVHGAMCMSYSGRCLLSSFLTGRDANRGGCAQPCRWNYRLVEERRPGEYFPVEESEEGSFLLSAWDLNMLAHVDELREAGLASLKVEGRMKSPYYVATVVNAYRRALDHTAPEEALLPELDCASHRDYSTGFYFGPEDARVGAGGYRQTCLFVGPVVDVREGRCSLEMRNRFGVGDRLEILSPHSMGESLVVRDLRDEEGRPLEEAIRTQQVVNFPCPAGLQPGDILRRRIL